MRYLPYAAASSEPNVIVDGTANDRTLIWLRRHAPTSGDPGGRFRRDRSWACPPPPAPLVLQAIVDHLKA